MLLDALHEGLILHNLRQRFLKDEIYTSIGGILIAVNPFKRLPLYGSSRIEAYKNMGNKQVDLIYLDIFPTLLMCAFLL